MKVKKPSVSVKTSAVKKPMVKVPGNSADSKYPRKMAMKMSKKK